jgi:hypothetical protein
MWAGSWRFCPKSRFIRVFGRAQMWSCRYQARSFALGGGATTGYESRQWRSGQSKKRSEFFKSRAGVALASSIRPVLASSIRPVLVSEDMIDWTSDAYSP